MPKPAGDWNGDAVADTGDEWIEIYNANSFAVDLSGWKLDDVANGGSSPFTIPTGTMHRGERIHRLLQRRYRNFLERFGR